MPAEVVGDIPADDTAKDSGEAEHAADEGGVAAALLGRVQVGDDGEHQPEQGGAAEALDPTAGNEHPDPVRQAAEHWTSHEDEDAEDHDVLRPTRSLSLP